MTITLTCVHQIIILHNEYVRQCRQYLKFYLFFMTDIYVLTQNYVTSLWLLYSSQNYSFFRDKYTPLCHISITSIHVNSHIYATFHYKYTRQYTQNHCFKRVTNIHINTQNNYNLQAWQIYTSMLRITVL